MARTSRPQGELASLLTPDSPLLPLARAAVAVMAPNESEQAFEAARLACLHRRRRRRLRMTGSVGFGIETLLTGEIVLQVLAGAFLQVAAETSLEQSVRWWQRRKARTDAARALVLQANHLAADQRLHLRNACLAHASVLGLNEQEALLLADAILGALTVAPARAVDGH